MHMYISNTQFYKKYIHAVSGFIFLLLSPSQLFCPSFFCYGTLVHSSLSFFLFRNINLKQVFLHNHVWIPTLGPICPPLRPSRIQSYHPPNIKQSRDYLSEASRWCGSDLERASYVRNYYSQFAPGTGSLFLLSVSTASRCARLFCLGMSFYFRPALAKKLTTKDVDKPSRNGVLCASQKELEETPS